MACKKMIETLQSEKKSLVKELADAHKRRKKEKRAWKHQMEDLRAEKNGMTTRTMELQLAKGLNMSSCFCYAHSVHDHIDSDVLEQRVGNLEDTLARSKRDRERPRLMSAVSLPVTAASLSDTAGAAFTSSSVPITGQDLRLAESVGRVAGSLKRLDLLNRELDMRALRGTNTEA